MRILKNKIARSAQAKNQENLLSQNEEVSNIANNQLPENNIEPARQIISQQERNSKRSDSNAGSTKTIAKNYGKAIASFATNKIAKPYLTPLLIKEGVKQKEFINYMSAAKESIEGIDTFRAILLIKPTDDKKQASYKRIFQAIAEVFIKFFSVNWIYSGRMVNKELHLKYRFKMLRRVRNPEFFTYLK